MGTIQERYVLRRGRSPPRSSPLLTRRKLSRQQSDDIIVETYNDNPKHLYGLDLNEEEIVKNINNRGYSKKKESGKLFNKHFMTEKVKDLSLLYLSHSWKVILVLVSLTFLYKEFSTAPTPKMKSYQFESIGTEYNTTKELIDHLKSELYREQDTAVNCSCEGGELVEVVNNQEHTISTLQRQIATTVNVVKSLSEKLDLLQEKIEEVLKKEEAEQKKQQNMLCQGEECRHPSTSSKTTHEAIEVFAADDIGLPDFALESAGGSIHTPHHSSTCDTGSPTIKVFGLPLWQDPRTPRAIISPGNLPGNCWPMKGTKGFVVVKLATLIKPSMVTLQHLDKQLDQYTSKAYKSAPREFDVYVWFDGNGERRVKVGSFVYQRTDSALQSFKLESHIEKVSYVELRVLSNYGNPQYTCVYRFRVHGTSHDWATSAQL